MRQTLLTITMGVALLAFAPSIAHAAPREQARLQIYRPVVSVVADDVRRTATTSIVVANVGKGTAESVILRDILRAPEDHVIGVEDWDLGSIGPGEMVRLSYAISFKHDAEEGIYRLLATVEGKNIATIAMNSNGFVTVGEASAGAKDEDGDTMFGSFVETAYADDGGGYAAARPRLLASAALALGFSLALSYAYLHRRTSRFS